jgi:predicted transcriptional regulator YheO
LRPAGVNLHASVINLILERISFTKWLRNTALGMLCFHVERLKLLRVTVKFIQSFIRTANLERASNVEFRKTLTTMNMKI